MAGPFDRHRPELRPKVLHKSDNHTPDIFPSILEFVRRSGLAEVQFTVLTPFPGTPLYGRLKAEGRLLRDRFWDACTLFDVNYRPKQMTVQELEQGLHWLFRQTYTATKPPNASASLLRLEGNAQSTLEWVVTLNKHRSKQAELPQDRFHAVPEWMEAAGFHQQQLRLSELL